MNKILLSAFILFFSTLSAQTWEAMGNTPVVRHHPITFSIDGIGYAVTGSDSNQSPTDDAFSYDPDTDTWTTLSDFPGTGRSFGIGTVVDGKAYLGFGASSFYLNDFWSFDPSTGNWLQLASCSCTGRRHPAMIAVGNRIYVGLGDDASGNLKDFWMYNIDNNTWIQIADIPGPERHHPFMFNANGEVFAGMGHGGPNIYKDWYKLDTTSNTWTAMNDFPGEARVAGTQFSFNGYGYVLSGDGDNHDYMEEGEMWRYDPSTDSWLEFPPHPGRSRWAPGSFVIDNDIYFFGGLNRFTGTFPNDVWKFADTTTSVVDTTITDTTTTSIGLVASQLYPNTYVYPNPAKQIVYWESDKNITEVKVFNTVGKLMKVSPAEAQQMETSNLSNGLYVIQFYTDSKLAKTSKLLIQH